MRKLATIGAVAALGMTGAAMAAEPGYTYVEAGYGYTDLQYPGEKITADGFIVGASLELPSNFVVFANYSEKGFDEDIGDLDQNDLSAGVGYIWTVTDTVDLITAASYEHFKLESGGSDITESGFGLRLGMRAQVTDKFELNGGVKYTDMDLEDTSVSGFAVSAGGRYYFTPAISGGLDIVSDKFVEGFSQINFLATVRYDFGKLF